MTLPVDGSEKARGVMQLALRPDVTVRNRVGDGVSPRTR